MANNSDATSITGTISPPPSEGLTIAAPLGVTLTGRLYETASEGLTATGTTQATALQLTAEISRLSIVALGAGVILPAAAPGLDVFIINNGANPVQVYGKGSDTIDSVAGATGVSQMSNSNVLYCSTAAGAWYSNGIGTGFTGSLPTVSFSNTLTAKAGGGQQVATPITTVLNRYTTVATTGDSGTLPVAVGGLQITITNAGANSMNVFPNTGDQINGGGANVAYALAAGKTAAFNSAGPGVWHAVLSA